jgi:hypothetical protein
MIPTIESIHLSFNNSHTSYNIISLFWKKNFDRASALRQKTEKISFNQAIATTSMLVALH